MSHDNADAEEVVTIVVGGGENGECDEKAVVWVEENTQNEAPTKGDRL